MSKEQMLLKIRRRLKASKDDRTRIAAVDSRMSAAKVNTVPQRAKLNYNEAINDFEKRIVSARATVSKVTSHKEIVDEIYRYLDHSLEKGSGNYQDKHLSNSEVCLNEEVRQLGLDFSSVPELNVVTWHPKVSLTTSITMAFSAVAESGSIVIRSSQGNGISQNFLGDTHIVLLRSSDIVGSFEDIWKRVREEGSMPRDLTLVSGPSCTGDIEMVMEYGAHGPKQLHIIIFSDDIEH